MRALVRETRLEPWQFILPLFVVAGEACGRRSFRGPAELPDGSGERARGGPRDGTGSRAMLESLTSIRRAGAHIILTYFAKDAARSIG